MAEDVAEDVAAELNKGSFAGIYMVSGKVIKACRVSHMSKQKLFAASSNPVLPGDAPEGVEAKMTFGTGGAVMLRKTTLVAFDIFLVEALEKSVFNDLPKPNVVDTNGNEGIQFALDTLKKNVSVKGNLSWRLSRRD